jgi:hypothetical protein
LQQNAEVVGTDEAFFEDDDHRPIVDLYNERAGILDAEEDTEVDLASLAYQIWKNAIDAKPSLATVIPDLPNVVFSARAHVATEDRPPGALVYMRTAEGTDALSWVNDRGENVTQSQLIILQAAACEPGTPALRRAENHHEIVQQAVEQMSAQVKDVGGQLGSRTGARFRVYQRLVRHEESLRGTLFESEALKKTIDDIYKYPLQPGATDTINRQLRSGVSDQTIAELVMALREEDRLSLILEGDSRREPQIICSLGLRNA